MLGIGLAAGEGVSVGLLAAIFVSNLPEAIGSATDDAGGRSQPRARSCGCGGRRGVCTLATVVGYALSDTARATAGRRSTASPPARSSSC